jgi:hypothetical protein
MRRNAYLHSGHLLKVKWILDLDVVLIEVIRGDACDKDLSNSATYIMISPFTYPFTDVTLSAWDVF